MTRPATPELFEPLVEAAGGWGRVAIVTLAPEVDRDLKTTRWLAEHGVIVALGHTNAPLDILREAESAGASIFTHLGNGCASMMPRHDNIINRALSLDRLKYSLIPDGHHLPWFVIKLWLAAKGIERFVFTTDCVTPADAPPGRYTVGHWEVDVGADGMVRPPGKNHLAGSALTMRQAYANAIHQIGLSERDAQRLTSELPGQLIAKFLR
jgi:N-acetylglucosamine-6-phosphate deacetylase